MKKRPKRIYISMIHEWRTLCVVSSSLSPFDSTCTMKMEDIATLQSTWGGRVEEATKWGHKTMCTILTRHLPLFFSRLSKRWTTCDRIKGMEVNALTHTYHAKYMRAGRNEHIILSFVLIVSVYSDRLTFSNRRYMEGHRHSWSNGQLISMNNIFCERGII